MCTHFCMNIMWFVQKKRLIAFRDKTPSGVGCDMHCGAGTELLYQLNACNDDMEIIVNYFLLPQEAYYIFL